MTTELKMTYSPTLGKLFEAMSKVQSKLKAAPKDKKNPFFKSSYADLPGVWDTCREDLTSNGFAVLQTFEGTKDSTLLITWLGHSSGEWMRSELPLLPLKQDPQAQGSAITYARRYALSAMVGVCADEDDDGEKAMSRKGKAEVEKPKAQSAEEGEEVTHFVKSWGTDMALMKEYLAAYQRKFDNMSTIEIVQTLKNDPIKTANNFDKWKAQRAEKMAKSA
jgi:hypothetical protein